MVKYTEPEIIVANAAREIKDRDIVVIGHGIPMAAGVLAKATHAPDRIILTEAGLAGKDPFRNPPHIADPTCTHGYMYSCDMIDVFTTIVNRGLVDVTFLGVGQIDRYGNMNSTVFGDYRDFRMRMMGAGGAPEFFGYARKAVLTMRGGRFVEKLDYVSSPGYLDGHGARERAGFPAGAGPKVLYSTKGVFSFDEETDEMYLDGIFPGHSVEEIEAEVPWDLKLADEVKTMPAPTQEEVDLVRNFAPDIAAGRRLQLELSLPVILGALKPLE
ncbi:MAG: CoA-transferase [Actinomycetota bacterium]|nr:CoA-transferase [Actinomycetota bacterium]